MSSERRLYAATFGTYLASRIVLFALGVRFYASYDWQFFHDQDLLKERLWESLLHTHAFTPFMNLLAGVVLKISDAHSVALYHGVFLLLGLTFVGSMTYVMRAVGFGRGATLVTTVLFFLLPAFIYFETMLHYEFIAAALLCLSAALFHRALVAGTWPAWFLFFLDCALIAYVRTTFHLVWLFAMLACGLIFQWQKRKVIVATALLPMLLVVALYAKNQRMFGFFGTSSMFGFNLAFVTTQQLTKKERRTWVKAGKMHPASMLSVYAGPDAYGRWVDVNATRGVPVLDRKTRETGQPNFNHASFIAVSKIRMRDNQTYLAHERGRYVRTVLRGVKDYFRPTSRWHPHDPEGSPHRDNRRVLEPYENFVNAIFHAFPVAPFGIYPLLVLGLCARVWLGMSRLWRSRSAGPLADKLLLVMALSVFYVPAVSCLVTISELERYRFLVESFMWMGGFAFFVRHPVAPPTQGA